MAEKKFDLMVVGELNIDLIMSRLRHPPELGKTQRADRMEPALGSSTAICASNCASLGLDVAFCGKVRTDSFGKFVMNALAERRVNADAVIVDPGLKTGATIIYNYDNDRMMVTHPGAMEHLSVAEVPESLFAERRHIHTSSIFFQPLLNSRLPDLFRNAKEHGLTTSMDTQWDPDVEWDLDLVVMLPHLAFFLLF